MPTIKPVSDLKNYSDVLQDVSFGAPVYLTKNGRGCYAIVDIAEQEEYEKAKAALRLMCELDKGRKSGEEQGFLSPDDIREHFRKKKNG
ncbi:MAG: type II toxin-antitoxin system prevent-host-death family antitoxin [Oscillospiraceae bacterium]|nr:type II toxin-antitoxin system prevent-host-death family antitoxin [Oscillospiraceae bacterium]MDD6085028.1 type II toxin-antitoxin system prevent-host-death family antitoxin [Oscillospiraceae bacterium]MDY3257937.1 type II toxin-antitoxin system prevent-host-death family antitoxin [Ruminococcus callidus]